MNVRILGDADCAARPSRLVVHERCNSLRLRSYRSTEHVFSSNQWFSTARYALLRNARHCNKRRINQVGIREISHVEQKISRSHYKFFLIYRIFYIRSLGKKIRVHLPRGMNLLTRTYIFLPKRYNEILAVSRREFSREPYLSAFRGVRVRIKSGES